jgi:hypothetical protein
MQGHINDAKLQQDKSGVGSTVETYLLHTTDGTWKAATLPAGVDCGSVILQVHSGSATDYAGSTAAGFLFSHDSDGSDGFFIAPKEGFSLNLVKGAASSLGYVKAATGAKLYAVLLR